MPQINIATKRNSPSTKQDLWHRHHEDSLSCVPSRWLFSGKIHSCKWRHQLQIVWYRPRFLISKSFAIRDEDRRRRRARSQMSRAIKRNENSEYKREKTFWDFVKPFTLIDPASLSVTWLWEYDTATSGRNCMPPRGKSCRPIAIVTLIITQDKWQYYLQNSAKYNTLDRLRLMIEAPAADYCRRVAWEWIVKSPSNGIYCIARMNKRKRRQKKKKKKEKRLKLCL